MFNPQNAYVQSQVMTQKPEKLVLLVFEEIRKALRRSLVALRRKELEAAHKDLVRAQDLLGELSAALDPEYEISIAMGQLYDYLSQRILAANISKNPQDIEEVLPFIEELKDTWSAAIEHVSR
ncbi:MAG: flagellar export chaperone FliS [Limnochordia bacterium]|nr:flagellar export chaperone FliS [Limnochordia bacterium]MDD2629372.1 flagellar export chaperone FliS [Limnochordia bacterium]